LRSRPAHDPGGKTKIRIPADWKAETSFSPCGRYRYKLMRRWGSAPMMMFGMMNPSTADERFNDPTVAKCCRIAQRFGFGGIYVANACAYRATDRMRLLEVDDPVGPGNYKAILEMAADSEMIVIAHGQLPGKLQIHAELMVGLLRFSGHRLYVLRIQNGQSIHPLARGKSYVPVDTIPVLWE
jgi:hypothetical protein